MRRTPRLLYAIIFISALVGGVLFAIKFAKGYRPSLTKKSLQGTGLLSANSIPKGATVFINDKLTTATDDTLNLPPGEYKVKIAKDGYIPWEKTLILEPELVSQTNTRLFPSVPNLKPLTFSGSLNPTPSPDGQKIVFAVEHSTTDSRNGLYVIDLQARPFSLNTDPRQITRYSEKYDFINAQLTWSPDSSQILATLNIDEPDELNVLLNPGSFNDIADLKDVTARLPVIIKDWQELLDKKTHQSMLELPVFMQELATQSAKLIYFSPNDEKLMYTATENLTIPKDLIPALPSSSTQPETRDLEIDNVYIYDIEEDKNFLISQTTPNPSPSPSPSPTPLEEIKNRYSSVSTQTIQWYPDSSHVIIVKEDKIIISEYDSTNQAVVYAGPFAHQFAYPYPNGSSLVILASLNGGSNLPPNLYSINLK